MPFCHHLVCWFNGKVSLALGQGDFLCAFTAIRALRSLVAGESTLEYFNAYCSSRDYRNIVMLSIKATFFGMELPPNHLIVIVFLRGQSNPRHMSLCCTHSNSYYFQWNGRKEFYRKDNSISN